MWNNFFIEGDFSMGAVGLLIKPASGLCNMRCDYCFYLDEAENRTTASYGIMTRETLKNVIRKTLLRAEGSYSIAFQGGEPTLAGLGFFEEAVRLIRQYNQKNVPVQLALQTNGYALNEDWARFFHQHHFLIGLSVDGTAAIHDRFRHGKDGSGTYERILEAARLLDQFAVDYNILTVVTGPAALSAREIYQEYQRRGWNYLQFISCLDPLGQYGSRMPWSLTPGLYGTFLIELFDCWAEDVERALKEGKEPLTYAPYIRSFDNYMGILGGYRPESCEQTGICRLSESTYVVEADGSVYPCDFYVLDEYRAGNFNDQRLDAIEEKIRAMGFTARSRQVPERCRSCQWQFLCRDGCYRSRLTKENGLDPETQTEEGVNYFCEGYQAFFAHSHDRMKRIADQMFS